MQKRLFLASDHIQQNSHFGNGGVTCTTTPTALVQLSPLRRKHPAQDRTAAANAPYRPGPRSPGPVQRSRGGLCRNLHRLVRRAIIKITPSPRRRASSYYSTGPSPHAARLPAGLREDIKTTHAQKFRQETGTRPPQAIILFTNSLFIHAPPPRVLPQLFSNRVDETAACRAQNLG